MKIKRILSLLIALFMLLTMIPFSGVSAAASASIVEIDGVRTAFASSFGKMNYDGKSYTSYKAFSDAMSALGAEGGQIIFTGTLAVGDYKDIAGRKDVTMIGTGTKETGNIVDFTGLTAFDLRGNIRFVFCNIKMDEDAVIRTNGFSLAGIDGFDSYHTLRYNREGADFVDYSGLASFATGTTESHSPLTVNLGKFNTVAAGAANSTLNGNASAQINGGEISKATPGNIGGGTLNGNASLLVKDGSVETLYAGTCGGTVNGNTTVKINGGTIGQLVLGSETGKVVGGIIAEVNGGTIGSIKVASSPDSTIVLIFDPAMEKTCASAKADYMINLTGGSCVPQFDGKNLTGFLFTDDCGIPATTIKLNGSPVSADNGIYSLTAGASTVVIDGGVKLSLNASAKYVAGYEDGTFRPQNNMTRAEAVTLLTRLLVDDSQIKGKISSSFADIQSGAWYESYVGLFEHLGFLDLVNDNYGAAFNPSKNITRGEFTQLLYEVAKLSGTVSSTSIKLTAYDDVNGRNEFSEAISFASSTGIVNGYEDFTFRPNNSITRAEVVTMVNRFLGRTPTGTSSGSSFSDIDSHWAAGQILASIGSEGVSWNASGIGGGEKYKLEGSNYKDYVTGLYNQSKTLTGDAIREGVDVVSEQMKQDILNTKDTLDLSGRTVYYISELHGDDNNDGLSPETAWKTLSALRKKIKLAKAGTLAFLFERGGVYRGTFGPTEGGIYGAYGTGNKPLIIQSQQNYADESLWEETKWKNVYHLKKKLVNVGVMAFDHDMQDYTERTYNETYGIIMNKDLFSFKGPEDLCGDLQFYSVLPNNSTSAAGDLYLYSTEGNPGARFKDIEIGEKYNIIEGAANNVTIDNISFKFCGGHGMGGAGGCKNRTIQNCIFSWIGGSILSVDFNGSGRPVNYGNAIEVYGHANGYYVDNCWIYQIYDTGITHQFSGSSGGDCTQQNIRYTGNLIEYVFWAIEVYNGRNGSTKRETHDVYMAYNVCRYGGYGWGCITRYREDQNLLYSVTSLSKNSNELTEYNVFDRSVGNLINVDSSSNEVDDKNIYIQTLGQKLGVLKGASCMCDYNSANYIRDSFGDKNAIVVVIDPTKEPIKLKKPAGLK